MQFAIELILALYVISFVWVWTLCRLSTSAKNDSPLARRESNVISFERGLELKDRERTGT